MFNINSITIFKECKYRRNLEACTYHLGNSGLTDFFGMNITLHTIVGKNGSGKSSLLDIVFRMVNNVGAVMCKREKREASQKIRYARHIFADLEYEKDKKCKLCVRDVVLWLEYGEDVYWLTDCQIACFAEGAMKKHHQQLLKEKFGDSHFHDYSNLSDDEKKRKLAEMFFYTVATNYSMLGFQASDYDDEDSLEWNDEIYVKNDDKFLVDEESGKFVVEEDWVEKKNWITGVFHKNDGYMCPIVLNPFRSGGQINMDNEASLAVSRLSALLISQHIEKHPLVEDFKLDHISYERKNDFYKRFKPIYTKDKKLLKIEKVNLLADGGDLKFFREAAEKKGTAAAIILSELSCPLHRCLSETEVFARMYLVYKILNIASTYPHYSEYSRYGDINKTLSSKRLSVSHTKLRELVREVCDRKTHIEQKVHQVLNFITRMNDLRNYYVDFDTTWLDYVFTFEDYRQHLELPIEFDSIEDCLRSLPPNIFRQTIYLKRKREDGTWEENIPFSKMSSGQKQMLYQLSTLIYHLLNLKSVPESDIHYKEISIVLDEIEVCFHPEFQRMFITRLLDLLTNRLHLNEYFGIHIWITTHSPFILSDIPNENIVYIEDGHQLTKDEIEKRKILPPMAANISDLLHQSFFLHNGFIGEYARTKIISVVEYLMSDRTQLGLWDMNQAKMFIDGIKEPFISKQLQNLYIHKKNAKNTD